MKIIIGKYSGFCNGVKYTVDKALEILKDNCKINCLGEIVHNESVINYLEKQGLKTINNIEEIEENEKLIIRAHGEAKEIYELCKKKNIEIFDLTCGKIRIIRNKVIKEKDSSYIIIIGKKKHPETIGILSFAGVNASIVEDSSDLFETIEKIKKSNLKRLYVVSQTTFSKDKFDILTNEIIKTCNDYEVIIDKTICDATDKRQTECLELAKKVDMMIIIGGKNSSNTKELYNISYNINKNTILIQDVNDLKNIELKKDLNIGIMAGASTPEFVIDEIVEYLNSTF